MNKKRILIFAFIGSQNLGDEVIFDCIVRRLKSMDLGLTISALSKDKKKTQKSNVLAYSIFNPIHYFIAISKADVVILGGGGLLQENSSYLNIPFFAIPMFFASALKRKIVIASIGADKIDSVSGKFFVSKLVRRANLITCRDFFTFKILTDLGANLKTTHIVTDPAIDYKVSSIENGKLHFPGKKGYVVISLRHWFKPNKMIPVSLFHKFEWFKNKNPEEYFEVINRFSMFLNFLEKELDLGLIFVSLFGRRDTETAKAVAGSLSSETAFKIIQEPISAEEFVSLSCDSFFVVAMRLHASILALTNNIPVMAFSYSEKVRQFMTSIELDSFVFSLEQINSFSARDIAKKIVSDRQSIKTNINGKIKELEILNDKNYNLIKDIILRKED